MKSLDVLEEFVRQTAIFCWTEQKSAGYTQNHVCYKICLMRRVVQYLSNRHKISAGQNENLPVL